MNQVQVLETPIKSENDKRDYRLIKLPNGLKAVLVHKVDEPDSEQKSEDIAAVNLAVRVGCFDDPQHVQGLAHFLEHLMFKGCEKYPGENSFFDFIFTHGGYSNAFTSTTNTDYEFTVSSQILPEALDRFSSIFVSPLLLQEAMQREREAVDSEYKMALDDSENLMQNVFKMFIKESHPASQFACGNLKTLKDNISDDDLHRELLRFFKKYAANRMCLAMQSKLSLDEMQVLVAEKFSAIKAASDEPARTLATSLEDIFKPEFFDKMTIMKPKNAMKMLRLVWVLPSIITKQYKTKPLRHLANIFDNAGEGGLSVFLRDRQWITSLFFVSKQDEYDGSTEFFLPYLNIMLTDLGAQNIDKILEAIFSYLLMIKETPIQEHRRLFYQYKDLMDLDFKFRREGSARETASQLIGSMINRDDIDIIRGSQLFEFDEDVITATINTVNHRKFHLTMVNDEHQTFDKKEKYYGTEYQEIDFPEAYQKIWDDRKFNAEFFLEEANPFIATNLEVFVDETESPKYPAMIVDDEIFQVWYKLDDKVKTPKVMVDIELMSPKVMSSVESFLYLGIYNDMFRKSFLKKIDQAFAARLSVSSLNHTRSLTLSFYGFNDKMSTLVEKTLEEIKYFNEHMDQSTFDSLKTQKKKSYYNNLISYSNWNNELIHNVLNEDYHFGLRLYEGVDVLTFENLQKFITNFYAKLKVKVLVHGNYRKAAALNIIDMIRKNLECVQLDEPYELMKKSFQVPLGMTVLRAKSLTPKNENSKLCSLFEIGKETLKTKNMAEILTTILHTKAYDYLRNKEQLGYSVGVSEFANNGICFLKLYVVSQESKNSYAKVQQKMETFMNEVAKKAIEELNDDEFESIRNSKMEKLLAAPEFLGEFDFWSEISNEEHIFNRSELKAKVLKSLTKAELQEFFKSFTDPNNMRKLIVQVIGSIEIEAKGEKESKIEFITEKLAGDENVIIDIQDFKNIASLHEIVRFSIE